MGAIIRCISGRTTANESIGGEPATALGQAEKDRQHGSERLADSSALYRVRIETLGVF